MEYNHKIYKILRYILMFIFTYLICKYSTLLCDEILFQIATLSTCCLVLLDIYFPIITIKKINIKE
jgi:hypothetical protein